MSIQTTPSLEAYVAKARGLHLDPVFLTQPGFMHQPATNIEPFIWRWSDAYPLMLQAGELLPVGSPGAERRVLNLINPGVTAGLGTSHTLTASIQMVLPGEAAPAHRHTPAALRFIIEGSGAQTTVDGGACSMSAGDLVLTPAMCWHDHSNPANDTMVWLDGLDLPMVKLLQSLIFQDYPEAVQPVTREAPPFLIYPWAETRAALERIAEDPADPFDGHVYAYTNRATRGSVLPTIDCRMTVLQPGVRTRAHRHSSSAVYHVIEGSGTTIVDGRALDWKAHDTFVLPIWSMHEHANASARERAVLFSFSDLPLFRALGIYQEEAHPDGHQ